MEKINVLDLFCGCGGLSEGFEDAGFEIVAGVDNDKIMIKSYQANHPRAKAICDDLTNLSAENILSGTKYEKCDIGLVIGGPPCQGFSTVGNRNEDDPRNKLFYQFLKIVREIKPSAFVMENVPGLLTMKHGGVAKIIRKEFENLGFSVKCDVLKAEEYGVPQKRRRVFFVGINKDIKSSFFWPKPSFGKKGNQESFTAETRSFRTVWESISDLPAIEAGEGADEMEYTKKPSNDFQIFLRNGMSKILYHKAPKHSKMIVERLQHIKQGQNHSNLPEHLKLKSGYANIYGRLVANEPADTITANCGCISAPGRFIHPFNDRAITIREAARLQTFRDSKFFFGSQTKKYKQVGNAVPPLLSNALAKEIKNALN